MYKALVVDDNYINCKLICEALKSFVNCDVALNGCEALEAYSQSLLNDDPYDIILLDIAMPEISGLETLHTIRERESEEGILLGDGIPIIMITAYKEPFLDAFNRGCDDYMVKPIDPEILRQKVKEKIASRGVSHAE